MSIPTDSAIFDGRRLLAVTAHPDDESLAFGGVLARCATTGGQTALVCLTRGELGWAGAPPRPADIPALARRRTAELAAAALRLGIAELRQLDFPDSRLAELQYAPMLEAVVDAIRAFEPAHVVTFGEDGLYWHADHIVVHYVTVAAVRSLGERAPALFEVVLPGGLMRRLVDRSRAAGASSTAGALWGVSPDAFGLHAEPPEFAVDVRAYVSQKLDALRCHESQLPVGHPLRHLAPREAVDLLGVEYFRRAPQADGAERA